MASWYWIFNLLPHRVIVWGKNSPESSMISIDFYTFRMDLRGRSRSGQQELTIKQALGSSVKWPFEERKHATLWSLPTVLQSNLFHLSDGLSGMTSFCKITDKRFESFLWSNISKALNIFKVVKKNILAWFKHWKSTTAFAEWFGWSIAFGIPIDLLWLPLALAPNHWKVVTPKNTQQVYEAP